VNRACWHTERVRFALCLLLLGVAACSAANDTTAPQGALVEAAAAGDLERVEAVLDGGADVDERDATGRTAVTAAVYGGHAAIVRRLVDRGADVDIQDDSSANAFLASGETGNVEVLREVLRGNPDVTKTNRFGGTALIPAADRGHVEMVRALLSTDVNVDHVNNLGWTALLEAVILGEGGAPHQEIVRLLIEAGANANLPDRDGVTPLQHARRRGYDAIAAVLETAGAR
jgi:uncharacterized protein